jgi:hypothetical protein
VLFILIILNGYHGLHSGRKGYFNASLAAMGGPNYESIARKASQYTEGRKYWEHSISNFFCNESYGYGCPGATKTKIYDEADFFIRKKNEIPALIEEFEDKNIETSSFFLGRSWHVDYWIVLVER